MNNSNVPPITTSPQENRIVFKNVILDDQGLDEFRSGAPRLLDIRYECSALDYGYPPDTVFDVVISYTPKSPTEKAGA
jgi:hypothetical protein